MIIMNSYQSMNQELLTTRCVEIEQQQVLTPDTRIVKLKNKPFR